MNLLKFKAWDEDFKLMYSGDEIEAREDLVACLSYGELHIYHIADGDYTELKPLQYTGIDDQNGDEIYQESVVLITGEQELDYGYTFRWNEKAIVKWDDVECGFYLDVINKREVKLCEDGCFTVDRFPLRKWTDEEWWIEYEVIHEHCSLLKGDSKDA